MRGWGLRLAAFTATIFVLAGSSNYVATHPKNDAAPLQPPVAPATGAPATIAPAPRPTPLPPLVSSRVSRPTASPAPLARCPIPTMGRWRSAWR